ncbi:MAG: hypothetical protein IJZ73_03490 [Clostridia bacterium]|nr:hypothetical protein [Clostridia bacterium]
MHLIRTNLSLSSIRKGFRAVLKFIYKIIDFLNLQLPLLVALIGVVLYFTGTFEKVPTVLLIFYVVMCASIVFSIVATVRHLLGFDKKSRQKEKKEQQEKIANENANVQDATDGGEGSSAFAQESAPVEQLRVDSVGAEIIPENVSVPAPSQVPVYFTVKQNPNYVMAEFSDRFELYLKTKKGLQKVRVDYKNKI